MMTDDSIHVAFAADIGYYQHVCVTLVSMLENNRDRRFHVHVLTNRSSDEAEAPLRSLENQYDNFKLDFLEVDDSQFSDLQLTIDYISIQTYYRYVLARLFPDLDKVLYLDCDLVVRGSLKELWAEDLNGYYAAGVADWYINKRHLLMKSLGFQGRNDYVNGGVLLFNLKAIRENNIIDEFFSCQQTHRKILRFQDQDVINMVLKDRIKLLSPRFNWIADKRPDGFDPIIAHYVGKVKPWTLHHRSRNVYKGEYFHYLLRTPYRHFHRHYHHYWYRMVRWCSVLCDCIFSAKANETAFRVRVFGIRVYKKTKETL